MKNLYIAAVIASVPLSSKAADVILPDANWGYVHLLDATGAHIDPETLDSDFDDTFMRSVGYNGPAFVDGSGPFAFGGVDGITANTTLATPTGGTRQTTYFRTTFTLGANRLTNPVIDLLVDDGAIIYLDGAVYRSFNMPEGASSDFFQFATGTVSETEHAILTTLEDGSTLLPDIGPGSHTIAISLHQVNNTSSDIGLSFSLSGDLVAIPEPSAIGLLTLGSLMVARRRRG